MTVRFAVVHEAVADFETATEIADRVLVDEIDWLEDSLPHSQRQWVSDDGSGGSLTWKSIAAKAKQAGIVARGHFAGEPAAPDAVAARRAIRYLRFALASVNAVVLVRDLDSQPQRHRGLKQARAEAAKDIPIVIGAANPKREAWIVCAFDPQHGEEHARLDAERRTLGFDPRTASDRLTATGDRDKRSAKRVLASLTDSDLERQRRCWQAMPLVTLEERGEQNGLAEFMREVRTVLVSLIIERE